MEVTPTSNGQLVRQQNITNATEASNSADSTQNQASPTQPLSKQDCLNYLRKELESFSEIQRQIKQIIPPGQAPLTEEERQHLIETFSELTPNLDQSTFIKNTHCFRIAMNSGQTISEEDLIILAKATFFGCCIRGIYMNMENL